MTWYDLVMSQAPETIVMLKFKATCLVVLERVRRTARLDALAPPSLLQLPLSDGGTR